MNTPPGTPVGRRHFCLGCLSTAFVGTAAVALTPRKAFAAAADVVATVKAAAAASPITTYRLPQGVSVMEGSGGNIAVVAHKQGRLLVDAGLSVSRPQILTALGDMGAGPVTHLVNTHWHFDHADGTGWFKALGASVTAHANTCKHLSSSELVSDWHHLFAPVSAGALPDDVFTGERTLALGHATVALEQYAPAHTDGDISAFFVEADILHCGDTYWNGHYPFVDYSTGGTLDGLIRATERDLTRTTDKTIVIPGHGHPVSNRVELLAYRDMLLHTRDLIGRLKSQGKSVEEVASARPTAAYDRKWGTFVVGPELFTRVVFEGV